MDTKTCIKLLKEAQRNDGLAETDENRDSLIQLCQQKKEKSRKSIFKSTGMQWGLERNGFLLLYSYFPHLALAI